MAAQMQCDGNLYADVGKLVYYYIMLGTARNSILSHREGVHNSPAVTCHQMVREVQVPSPVGVSAYIPGAGTGGGDDGFVQSVVMYTVMDGLAVKLTSPASPRSRRCLKPVWYSHL